MNLLKLLKFIWMHPLNGNGKIQAILRLARWQLASRLIRSPIALPFINKTKLVAETGMEGATGNWYCGLHEPDEMGFVLHALRPGDLFMDVGANVGSYSVLAAGAVGARVIAIEPIPATFEKLLTNIRYNDLSEHIRAHCVGLSSETGELQFTAGLDSMNRIALPGETIDTTIVPVTTMDELLAGRIPNVIKIDVEGHEAAVLAGGIATLSEKGVEAVLMETNGCGTIFGVSDDELFEAMSKHGFLPCAYDASGRKLSPAEKGTNNTIFIRNVEAMQERCRSAPSYRLINGTI